MKYVSCLLSLLFFINIAFANSLVGRVVVTKGSVHKKDLNGKSVKLKNGDKLYEGDLVDSADRSYVKILMRDDTVFQLGPKTQFKFEKFAFKTKKKRTATYKIMRGKVRSLFTFKDTRTKL